MTLYGFVSPSEVASLIAHCEVLVAPFYPTPHMCTVAHTKLSDYAAWQRPILAPDLPQVRSFVERFAIPSFLFDAKEYPHCLEKLVEIIQTVQKNRSLLHQKQRDSMQSEEGRKEGRLFCVSWQRRCAQIAQSLSL